MGYQFAVFCDNKYSCRLLRQSDSIENLCNSSLPCINLGISEECGLARVLRVALRASAQASHRYARASHIVWMLSASRERGKDLGHLFTQIRKFVDDSFVPNSTLNFQCLFITSQKFTARCGTKYWFEGVEGFLGSRNLSFDKKWPKWLWSFQDRRNKAFSSRSIEINNIRMFWMFCFGHRDGSSILLLINAMLLNEMLQIHCTRDWKFNSFNFHECTFFWVDSKCCTLVVLNSGFELGVGVGTRRAQTP